QTIQLKGMKLHSCIACGSQDLDLTPTLRPSVQLIQCRHCGMSHTFPRLDPKELEQHYSETYYGPENVKFTEGFERIVAWNTARRARSIHHLLRPHSRILEIGCGRGLLLRHLSQLGHECHGTERSELAAQRARKTVGLRIYTLPLEQCGIEPHSFDLVILWHVLEHLEEPEHTLTVVHQLLKPGGKLLLEVPNYSSCQSRYSGKHWFHLDLDRHLYHFSQEGLNALLAKTRFQVQKQSTFSWEQCPYGALQSSLNLLGFPTEQFYRLLKREISLPWGEKAFQFLLAGLLAGPAAGFSLLEAGMGRGGVLRIVAESQPA
ncbi:MAG: class I SAM-dependent methyltransferase, partial [Terriglobia bacterium]